MSILINLLVNGIAVYITAYLLQSGVQLGGFFNAIVVSVVLAIVNTFVKPILTILTFPLTVVTLGLFLFVINAVVILIVSAVVPGFHVDNFLWALAFSIVLSLVSTVLNMLKMS